MARVNKKCRCYSKQGFPLTPLRLYHAGIEYTCGVTNIESSSVHFLFGSNLPHVASVRGMARCGGRIGDDDILKLILGDSADGERVYSSMLVEPGTQGEKSWM